MINLQDYFSAGSTIISYNNGLSGCILIEFDRAVVPIVTYEEELKFIYSYPNVMEKLKNGAKIYLNKTDGYLGREEFSEPYAEQQEFVSEYESSNVTLSDLIGGLDDKIKRHESKEKRLLKIGNFYKEQK